VEGNVPVPMSSVAGRPPLERAARIAFVVGANGAGTYAVLGYLPLSLPSGVLLFALSVGIFVLAYRWGLHRDQVFLATWVVISLAAALMSLWTGAFNGLTDEAYITPALAGLWPNLYGTPVTLVYVQYGRTYTLSDVYNVYLPLLPFLRIPGIDYRWTTLGAWVASLYLIRRRGAALTLWGGLWVGLMAANGFNDFVPLLVLTLAYVTLTGTASKVAEVVSLALKQFANVIVVAVHLYHRRWKEALIAVLVTVAILAPFAYLSPGGVWCHAILIQSGTCATSSSVGPAFGVGVLNHLNYPLWPLWVLAIFGPGYVRSLRNSRPSGFRGQVARIVGRVANAPEAPSIGAEL
jgi:hypothetical protein